jgi:hypothetical protein
LFTSRPLWGKGFVVGTTDFTHEESAQNRNKQTLKAANNLQNFSSPPLLPLPVD